MGPEADGVRDKASVNSVDARGCTAGEEEVQHRLGQAGRQAGH